MELTENEKKLWDDFGQELWIFIQKEAEKLPMEDPMVSGMLLESAIDLFTEAQCMVSRFGITREMSCMIIRGLARQMKDKMFE